MHASIRERTNNSYLRDGRRQTDRKNHDGTNKKKLRQWGKKMNDKKWLGNEAVNSNQQLLDKKQNADRKRGEKKNENKKLLGNNRQVCAAGRQVRSYLL